MLARILGGGLEDQNRGVGGGGEGEEVKEGQTCCLICVHGLMIILQEDRVGEIRGGIREPRLLDVL